MEIQDASRNSSHEKSRNYEDSTDSSSSDSDKERRRDVMFNESRKDRNHRSRKHLKRHKSRSNSESSDGDHHRNRSHKHSDSSRRSHHHRHHRSRSDKKSSRSSDGKRSDSRRRRSRSRDKSRISRSSHGRYHRSSRHRRSRSPRRSRSGSRSPSPPTGYDRAMDAQERLARRLERARELMKRKAELTKKEQEDDAKRVSGLSPLDKVQEAVKRAGQIVSGDSTVNTSQEGISAVASAQIEALKAKALAETGIEVPSYYNPLAVNPMSYAQQAIKRKMLWSKKDDNGDKSKDKSNANVPGKSALWSGVKFGDDKSNEKFAKLMGIKGDPTNESGSAEASAIIKKQAEVFQNLDMQYQQARITTHTQRGLGLGFSTSMINPNSSTQQPTSTS